MLAHHSVIKFNSRAPSAEFPHLKTTLPLARDVQTLAVTIGRKEHVIIFTDDRFGEGRIGRHGRHAVRSVIRLRNEAANTELNMTATRSTDGVAADFRISRLLRVSSTSIWLGAI